MGVELEGSTYTYGEILIGDSSIVRNQSAEEKVFEGDEKL